MARAIVLARKGLYSTMPNPRVGCVLVRDGAIVGEGWHVRAGEGHAEVNALASAGARALGATAYVTLEPCSHTGKTGPCCDALIRAGVARVVFAMQDPNPLVAGRGLARLRAAGVAVAGPLLEAGARALNPGFIRRMEHGVPWVRCKLAMSLDGRTAMASGESQWITGPAARADVQALRARSCAIVTGIESVLQDDSSLTLRRDELWLDDPDLAVEKSPLRVVLDSRTRLRPGAKVLQSPPATLLVSALPDLAPLAEGVTRVHLPAADGRIDLPALLQLLAQRQCNEVLVEAGATLAGAFMEAGLIDELIVYMAPTLLGSSARPLLELPLQTMAEQRRLIITDMRAVGSDWRITAEPESGLPAKG
jgi:diaminohydroxyphosphoribosylaminopyrimidine deaminase/5-amino-6-(5-phosphoribosylamino)uracil reductase